MTIAHWIGYGCLALSMALVGSYVALSKPLLGIFPVFLLATLRFLVGAFAMVNWIRKPATEAPLSHSTKKLLFLESMFGAREAFVVSGKFLVLGVHAVWHAIHHRSRCGHHHVGHSSGGGTSQLDILERAYRLEKLGRYCLCCRRDSLVLSIKISAAIHRIPKSKHFSRHQFNLAGKHAFDWCRFLRSCLRSDR